MANQVELALFSGGAVTTDNPVPVSGTIAGAAVDADPAGTTSPVPVGGIYEATPTTYTTADRVQAHFDARGNLKVALFSADSTAGGGVLATPTDGKSNTNLLGFITVAYGGVFNGTSWDREVKPNAVSRIVSAAATTNATVAKASAGNLHKVVGYNAAAALRYLKIYNKATAPTVGTDTPVLTIPLPGTAAFEIDFAALYFATGIGYAFTTGVADADTGALTLADITAFSLVYA
jgi:hypothetical protein